MNKYTFANLCDARSEPLVFHAETIEGARKQIADMVKNMNPLVEPVEEEGK